MRKIVFLFLLLSLLLLFVSTGVQAATGGYTVKPYVYDQDLIDKGLIDSNGADATITFWELPLWIQIFYISGILASIFGMFKGIPLILGKVKYLHWNQNRLAINRYIQKNPGCGITEMVKELNINKGTAVYHLAVLKKAGKLSSTKNNGCVRYFENNAKFGEYEQKILLNLRNNTKRMILDILVHFPDSSRKDIAEKLCISGPSVTWHMKRLSSDQIVGVQKAGRNVRYHLSREASVFLTGYLMNNPGEDIGNTLI